MDPYITESTDPLRQKQTVREPIAKPTNPASAFVQNLLHILHQLHVLPR